MMEALLFDTHRGTSHDGEGLRTTFFFQGCPLRCKWCHNPEGMSHKPLIKWDAKKCIGCRKCRSVCPEGAIDFPTGEGLRIERAACTCCKTCTSVCPAGSLKISARSWTVAELIVYAEKDKAYYDTSHGGVTFSGGEASMQSAFISEAAGRLHAGGIRTALDTAGCCEGAVFASLFPCFDYILFDVKLFDNTLHEHFTGIGNALILENLDRIIKEKRKGRYAGELWIRTPIIPGATDSEEQLADIGRLLHSYGDFINRWELCAFNNMCREKYRNLGIPWEYMEADLIPETRMLELFQVAKKITNKTFPVFHTGITAKSSL